MSHSIRQEPMAVSRLLTAPLHRAENMAGHLLAMFAIAFLQTSLLVSLGQFALDVDYLCEPLGTLLMIAALGLCMTSLGLLIGALAICLNACHDLAGAFNGGHYI